MICKNKFGNKFIKLKKNFVFLSGFLFLNNRIFCFNSSGSPMSMCVAMCSYFVVSDTDIHESIQF